MRVFAFALIAACALPSAFAIADTIAIDIAKNGIGVPPDDFDFWQTNGGKPGRWAVIRDATASSETAIEQFSSDLTENHFPIAVYKPLSIKNAEISARFKLLQGTMEAAGIAFRLTSASSYYVVRASALEERVDLHRVVDGKVERIAGADADIKQNRWHMLGVVAQNDKYAVWVDNKLIFTAWDRTFLNDGHVALWTEDDNVTRFEEIKISPLPYSQGD